MNRWLNALRKARGASQPWSPLATEDDIRSCFRLLLGRQMNAEEVQGHLGLAGRDLSFVVQSYLTSREFADRHMLDTASSAERYEDRRGFTFFADPNDPIGGAIASDQYEPHVVSAMETYVKPGMTVLDIGANVGYFALLGSKLVGPEGRVIAVELMSSNARMIEASRLANGFDHLTVVQAAATDALGPVVVNRSYSNGEISRTDDASSVLGAEMAVGIPVDMLVSGPVHFIKMDVEGAEGAALRGMIGTIANSHPVIVTEFSPTRMPSVSGSSGIEFLDDLIGHGYTLSLISAGLGPQDLGRNALAVMEAYAASGGDHIDLLALPIE